ncbi:MAG TPA: class I SAM-dependent methyltransferase [Methylomirabilota bacterium]|nr:class I SAM-dependent methyltransferase [Methylomirabilota bacterium]
MSHQETYKQNQAYTDFLAGWDPKFYAKYTDTLRPEKAGGRVLDVGCGAGQVVGKLTEAGYEAWGVEVSETSVAKARLITPRIDVYDGLHLPFPSNHFASVGALNVLEHVEQPEAFLTELVRVTMPGGKVVVSSPNFLRALGYKDYHPRMRGIGNKWRNFQTLLAKRRQMRTDPGSVRFERMQPIVKEPFTPDDDAIVATNPLEIAFFLRRAGCRIRKIACTDRYVPALADLALNLTPTRYMMFNGFVVAEKQA